MFFCVFFFKYRFLKNNSKTVIITDAIIYKNQGDHSALAILNSVVNATVWQMFAPQLTLGSENNT